MASSTNPANPTTAPVTSESFIKKYPRTAGILGNAAFGVAQTALEKNLVLMMVILIDIIGIVLVINIR